MEQVYRLIQGIERKGELTDEQIDKVCDKVAILASDIRLLKWQLKLAVAVIGFVAGIAGTVIGNLVSKMLVK